LSKKAYEKKDKGLASFSNLYLLILVSFLVFFYTLTLSTEHQIIFSMSEWIQKRMLIFLFS